MLKLLAVPELNLRVSDIELSAEMSAGYRHTPTSWLGPTYDPVSMVTQLAETLNGQVVSSNRRWPTSTRRARRTGWRRALRPSTARRTATAFPFAAMARKIAHHVGEQAPTVNALGCGDGRVEAVLTASSAKPAMPKQTELFSST